MEKKFFSFLFNTVFYSRIPKETIKMPFRGLTMLKSRKLVIKGGLCYRFAMVQITQARYCHTSAATFGLICQAQGEYFIICKQGKVIIPQQVLYTLTVEAWHVI